MQRLRQPQHGLQQRQRSVQTLRGRGSALCLLAGIFDGQLRKTLAVAPLRHQNGYVLVQLFLQKLGKRRRILHGHGQQDALGRGLPLQIILLDQRGKRLGRIIRHGKHLIILVHEIPTDEMQHRKAGLGFGLIPADHIGVRHRAGSDQLALAERGNGLHPVAQLGRALEFEILRRCFHLILQFIDKALIFSLQQGRGLLHQRVVLGLRLAQAAPAVALVHLKIQAGPLLSLIARELLAASRQMKGRADGLDHLLGTPAASVGAEVLCAVVLHARSQRDCRIVLPQVKAQIGIALVVLQQDVVFGHIVLDERTFQHQRLKFRRSRDGFKMVDLRNHPPCFRRVGGGFLKVLTHPVFQFFCLADVDHRIVRAFHQVDARLIRQRQRGELQFFLRHVLPP